MVAAFFLMLLVKIDDSFKVF